MKKLLLGSFLAGLAMFFWGFVSWMLLGWHNPKALKNEAAFVDVIKANILAQGALAGAILAKFVKQKGAQCS